MKCPNISDWRRKTFGDFTSAFRFEGKPAAPPAMPDTTGDLNRSEYEVATLPAPSAPGRAIRCRLPRPPAAGPSPRRAPAARPPGRDTYSGLACPPSLGLGTALNRMICAESRPGANHPLSGP